MDQLKLADASWASKDGVNKSSAFNPEPNCCILYSGENLEGDRYTEPLCHKDGSPMTFDQDKTTWQYRGADEGKGPIISFEVVPISMSCGVNTWANIHRGGSGSPFETVKTAGKVVVNLNSNDQDAV